MKESIGIRLPKDVLKQIDKLSKEEREDRSTIIRKLVLLGYSDLIKRRALEKYVKGKTTFSDAARQAGLTLWDMEVYMVENGVKSDYSLEDLDRETDILRNKSAKFI